METQKQDLLMTLPEASTALFGNDKKVNSLRTEIRKGNLVTSRIAGTFYVTMKDLKGMQKKCLENQKAQDSISDLHGGTKVPPTLLETVKKKSPRDAALMKLRMQKNNLQNTSRKNGSQQSSATVVSIVQR